jgi:hypothetical protein
MATKLQRFRMWNQKRKQKRLEALLAPLTKEIQHLKQHRSWLWDTTERYMNRYRAAEAKLRQKLIDIGYPLGEEAFRAGFHAGHRARDNGWIDMAKAEDHYWSEYEPSEEMKALIK